MPLISVVLTIIVVGLLLWLYETYFPGTPAIKRIVHVLVIVVVILWLLDITGILAYLDVLHLPRVHH